MSDLSEKLEPPRLTQGRSRQTLFQLRQAWGRLEVVEGTAETPLRIVRRSMGDFQSWVLISGKGSQAIFELQREA